MKAVSYAKLYFTSYLAIPRNNLTFDPPTSVISFPATDILISSPSVTQRLALLRLSLLIKLCLTVRDLNALSCSLQYVVIMLIKVFEISDCRTSRLLRKCESKCYRISIGDFAIKDGKNFGDIDLIRTYRTM